MTSSDTCDVYLHCNCSAFHAASTKGFDSCRLITTDIPLTKHQRIVAADIKEPPLLPTGTRTFPVQMTFRHVRRVYKRTRVHTALLSRRHHITHHIDSKLTPRPYGPEAEHITTVTSLQSHLYLHLSTPLYRIA